jgi:hypothetical protein
VYYLYLTVLETGHFLEWVIEVLFRIDFIFGDKYGMLAESVN